MLSEKVNRFHLLIIFILLATSGFPSFLSYQPFIPLMLPFLYYRLIKTSYVIPKITTYIVVFLFTFFFIHFLIGHLTFLGALSFFLKFVTLLFVTMYLGSDVIPAFIRVMKFISVISLIVWFLIVIFPFFKSVLIDLASFLPQLMSDKWIEHTSNEGVSLYLYFLPTTSYSLVYGLIRNCGPFFEPGLFASYLSLALILSLSSDCRIFKKDNLLFLLALLSTCSSAGYVSLILIFLFVITYTKNVKLRIIFIFIALVLWQPILNLDFMSEKISNNYNQSNENVESRFGAILYHCEKIVESPFIGYAGGYLPQTSLDKILGNLPSEKIFSPNGLSYAFVYWGIPLALMFYFLLYKSILLYNKFCFSKKSRLRSLFVFLVLLSTGFSQTITTEAIFLLMSLIPIYYNYESE